MEEKEVLPVKNSAHSLAVKGAAAYAVYFLVLIYIFKLIGLDQNDVNMSIAEKVISSVATYVPFILAIAYVQLTFKNELGGFISFGKAFSAGFRLSVYAGLLIAILMLLYYKVLDTGALEKMTETAVQAAGDDENKIKGVEMMKPYMLPMICFGFAINYTFLGLIISLISAAIVKKEQPLYE